MTGQRIRLRFQASLGDDGQLPSVGAQVVVGGAKVDTVAGELLLSNTCVGPEELRAEIARLRRDLDTVEDEGIRRFEKHYNSLGHPQNS